MSIELVWVVVEHQHGHLSPTSLELVTAARGLSVSVEAVAYGPEGADLLTALGAHGVTVLHDVGDLGDALVAPGVAGAIAAAIGAGAGPDAIFVATSYDGRDIAARLSARLDRPLLTNVVGVSADAEGIRTEHALFGGSEIATARFTGPGPALVVIRPKSIDASEVGGAPAEYRSFAAAPLGRTDAARIVERQVDTHAGPSLDGAAVVVSGGRGLGEKDDFALIERLAAILGGAPGASRAIVDAGWVPYSYQVGQTGKIVKPEVYLAFGISGATQHLVGMQGAKHIIAVNKDESAPIFSIADLGIIGDVHDVLPKLLASLEAGE